MCPVINGQMIRIITTSSIYLSLISKHSIIPHCQRGHRYNIFYCTLYVVFTRDKQVLVHYGFFLFVILQHYYYFFFCDIYCIQKKHCFLSRSIYFVGPLQHFYFICDIYCIYIKQNNYFLSYDRLDRVETGFLTFQCYYIDTMAVYLGHYLSSPRNDADRYKKNNTRGRP